MRFYKGDDCEALGVQCVGCQVSLRLVRDLAEAAPVKLGALHCWCLDVFVAQTDLGGSSERAPPPSPRGWRRAAPLVFRGATWALASLQGAVSCLMGPLVSCGGHLVALDDSEALNDSLRRCSGSPAFGVGF